uniref:CCHC-type domain-containing protein n=1 Tax=Lactuca sativa TaxID=4236 RepID=A0A9R1W2P7_LACSA|nr:hypothetical protein LSAT_V11C300126000 [Lactuca sativa]
MILGKKNVVGDTSKEANVMDLTGNNNMDLTVIDNGNNDKEENPCVEVKIGNKFEYTNEVEFGDGNKDGEDPCAEFESGDMFEDINEEEFGSRDNFDDDSGYESSESDDIDFYVDNDNILDDVEVDMNDFNDNIDMDAEWVGAQEFKERVKLHAIETKRELGFEKNDKNRVRVMCRGTIPKLGNLDNSGEGQQEVNNKDEEKCLWSLYAKLQKHNPDTTVKIDVESEPNPNAETRTFKCIYICLGPLKKGFAAGRRDFLGLDGAFMKGPYPGQILSAVFQRSMEELRKLNNDVYEWLKNIPPQHWSRSHFTSRAHTDAMLNNMCESLNSKIVEGRDVPIITCLEYIREYLMKKIVTVQKEIDKTEGPLTPTTTIWVGKLKKEVTQLRRWEIIGISCAHAITTMWEMLKNKEIDKIPEHWVHRTYWLETWKNMYSFTIQPINGRNMWEKSTCPTTLLHPKHHVPIGRPKKKRRRSAMEVEDLVKGNQLSRAQKSVTCSKCNKNGHNARTCKGQKAGGSQTSRNVGGSQTSKNVRGVGSAKVKVGSEKVKAGGSQTSRNVGGSQTSKNVGGAGSAKVKAGSEKVKAGSEKVKAGGSKTSRNVGGAGSAKVKDGSEKVKDGSAKVKAAVSKKGKGVP